MIKKSFFLGCLFAVLSLSVLAQEEEIFAARDIEIYKKEATQLVNYFGYTINLIGSSSTLAKEKDIIINQSFLKIFQDEDVQIEDDLDEYRTVPTNKDVQAYLKDIDFFFTHAEIIFTIEDVSHHFTENDQLYFKFQVNRNLIGNLINGDSINTNKLRFIEINFDDANQDLKIASIYTTKLNEKEEHRNWWNTLPDHWKELLAGDQFIEDSLYLKNIHSFTDSVYITTADSFKVFQLDTLLVEGLDTISYPSFDSMLVFYPDTICFDPTSLYDHLSSIIGTSTLDLTNDKIIIDLNPLTKLTNLSSINLTNTLISDLSPLRNLTKLVSLVCTETPVESLSPLRYLTNLRVLNLDKSAVQNLKPLTSIDKLEQLYLSETKIDSLDPLSQLIQLKDLRFSNTQISDLYPLKDLINLEVLHLNASKVSSVDALKNLENLRILVMDDTRVDKLDPLTGLKNIRQIFCDNAMVSPAEANQFMKQNPQGLVVFQSEELMSWWEELDDTWKNAFKKYRYLEEQPTKAQLQDLMKLKIIDLSNRADISNLEPLKKLIYLEHLNCASTSISELGPISDLVDLKYLDFSLTNVGSILPLKNLSKLESVYFSNTSVDDLAPLYNFNYLQQIHANHSSVKDLSPLAEQSNLKFIYCDDTKVSLDDYLDFASKNEHTLVVFQSTFLQQWWENISDDWKQVFLNKIKIKEADLGKETLQKIANIQSLDISNNLKLRTLEPLKILSNLNELIFTGTQISNLQPLENLTQLSKIVGANNPINNLAAIINLPMLKHLDISNIPIRDFEQIQFMINLETLICPGTQIKSLKYLDYLKNLKVLECYNTNIKNLNAIESLNLELIKCYNTGLNQKRVSKFKSSHPNTEVVYY
jgi:Leucine-rich repeat (LRR) protein